MSEPDTGRSSPSAGPPSAAAGAPHALLGARAECRALIDGHDWARSPLGPVAGWPRSLRAFVSMILEMPTPAILFWGPDQLQLYNDGYAVIMGPRHPRYFAEAYRDCWPDTYPIIHPWMQRVLQRGEVIQVERELFTLTRHGFTEEAYFTFTFSPLRDDDGKIAGIFQPVVEVTEAVVGDRRSALLRALVPRPGSTDAVEDVFTALAGDAKDVPFALLVRWPDAGGAPELLRHVGVDSAAAQRGLPSLAATVREVCQTRRPRPTPDVQGWLPGQRSPWEDPARDAWAYPVMRSAAPGCDEVLIFGASPRLRFDERYDEFLGAISHALSSNLSVEESKRGERESLAREQGIRDTLERERQQLRRVFLQAPVAITILRGREHIVELANPAVCRLWGRTPEQVLGRPIFGALPEATGQGLEQLLDGVLASGEAVVGKELPVRLARLEQGGTEVVYFNFVYEPLRDEDGAVDAVMVVATDVTEHVRARHDVEALAASLRVSEEQLRKRADFERHLIGIVSHDLRSPLAAILVHTQLALRREDLEPRTLKTIQRIHAGAERATRMVQDLLDFTQARIGGGIPIEARRTNLREVVERVVHEASLTFAERTIAIDAVDAWGEWDADRLAQAVSNLLVNALKYSPPETPVTVRVRDGEGATVELHNHGQPIPRELQRQLFEPFHRGTATSDKMGRSVGLGLYIVDRIVRAHGGTVTVDSGEERGTTFTIRLPPIAVPPARANTDVA